MKKLVALMQIFLLLAGLTACQAQTDDEGDSEKRIQFHAQRA